MFSVWALCLNYSLNKLNK